MKHKTKYGLNSGNTFHFGSRIQSFVGRQASRQNVIVKTYHDPDAYLLDAALEDGLPNGSAKRSTLEAIINRLIPDGGLPFASPFAFWSTVPGQLTLSMNKRRRWLLPQIISAAIDRQRANDELVTKIAAAEVKFEKRKKEKNIRSLTRHNQLMASSLTLDELCALDTLAYQRPANFRIVLSRRLINGVPNRTESLDNDIKRKSWELKADCFQYKDSAVAATKPTNHGKRQRTAAGCSFFGDLRINAVQSSKSSDLKSLISRKSDRLRDLDQPSDINIEDDHVSKIARVHTRGQQRIVKAKVKRSNKRSKKRSKV